MVTVSPPVEVQVIVSLTSDVKMHRFVPFLFSCLISGLVAHPLHENLSYRAWCCHDLLEPSRQCRQTIRPHTTHTATRTHTHTQGLGMSGTNPQALWSPWHRSEPFGIAGNGREYPASTLDAVYSSPDETQNNFMHNLSLHS